MLGTARPEEAGRDHPLTGLSTNYVSRGSFGVSALSARAWKKRPLLAIQVAGRECDPAFLNGLYQATKGNPLFVVESVRASLEHFRARRQRISRLRPHVFRP